MNVWTYWSGPKPEWIDICLKSIARCCRESKFHLLTPENIHEIKLDLHPSWVDHPPGVGTDCLRAALLATYGGLWIDADTVCMVDPINLIRNRHDPSEFLYNTWSSPPERYVAGYVYAPAGHPIALRWLRIVNAYLPVVNLGWGDLGERALGLAIRGGGGPTWEMPRETFLPIDIDRDVQRYFRVSGWRDFMTDRTIAFGLNYSWMQHNHPRIMALLCPRDEKRMICRLLRYAEVENAKQAS